MAREQVVTEEVQSIYATLVHCGCSRRRAAMLAGVSESTVRSAMQRDEAFADRVLRSEQRREAMALRNMQTASEKSWRASAWLLERIHPREYGKQREDAISRGEVAHIFSEFTGALLDAIRNPDDRRTVLHKLDRCRRKIKLFSEWEQGEICDEAEPRYRPGSWIEQFLGDDEEDDAPPNEPTK